jgi:hypothetical protein
MVESIRIHVTLSFHGASKVPKLVQWSTLCGYNNNDSNLPGYEKAYRGLAQKLERSTDSYVVLETSFKHTIRHTEPEVDHQNRDFDECHGHFVHNDHSENELYV